jgi:hypothetical protein
VFLKTGRTERFGAKPDGVENRRGLTERVLDVGRCLTPGGPIPV